MAMAHVMRGHSMIDIQSLAPGHAVKGRVFDSGETFVLAPNFMLLLFVAWSGHTPSLRWLRKSEGQVLQHWEELGAADMCAVLWAWGRFSFTPHK